MMLASHASTVGLAKSLFHLKELFLVGFFLSVGLGALPDLAMVVMALLLLLLLPIKSALYYLVLMRFKLRTRTGVLSTLALTNYSEFGLIVAAIVSTAGWLSPEWLVVISLALAGRAAECGGRTRLRPAQTAAGRAGSQHPDGRRPADGH